MVADKIPKTNSQTLHTHGSSPLTLGQQLCSPGTTRISTALLIFSLQPFSSSAMKLWTGSVGLQTTANFPSPLSVSPKPQLLQATASVLQGHPKSLGKGSRIQGTEGRLYREYCYPPPNRTSCPRRKTMEMLSGKSSIWTGSPSGPQHSYSGTGSQMVSNSLIAL